jgi:heme/copper-type cytochrome/quinol oxidase subunit 2
MPARYWVFAACVAACVIGHGAILLSVSRRSVVPVEPGVPRPRRVVEILWALIPAIALAFVLTATWDRVRQGPAEPPIIMKVAR